MPEDRPRHLPDHVTTPLLDRITRGSLDEDYRVVAERRAGGGPESRSGRSQLTAAAVVAVFGVLVTVAAVQTSRNADVTDASRATLIARVESERQAVAAEQDRIAALQDRDLDLEAALEELTADQQEAVARMRRLEVVTGYLPVSGPGVRVVVDDAPDGDASQMVRDEDLAMLVAGLWRAGAEAIAINGQRLTVLSSISNTGPAVHVNTRPVNAPYTVSAVGDTRSLQADLQESTYGQRFFDLAGDLDFVVSMQNEDELTLPSARGPRLRHVRAGTSGRPGLGDTEEGSP
jgi:uncharacterized protein YlxW (UPF0749 family)